MIICIQSPPRLLMMPDQKSLTCRWLSCSGWGRERVSVVFSYKGGRFIRKGQWCVKVNILWLTIGYLNTTIIRKTWNTEPKIGTNGSSQTRQNPRVDRYGSGFGPPRHCGSGFWTVLEPNRTVFQVRTQTTGRLPGPVANTTSLAARKAISTFLKRCKKIQQWVLRPQGQEYAVVVLATVPLLDRFYYSGSKKTRNRPVWFLFLANGSLKYVHQYLLDNLELGMWNLQLCMVHLLVVSNVRYV